MHILLVYNILFFKLKHTVLWISGILGISLLPWLKFCQLGSCCLMWNLMTFLLSGIALLQDIDFWQRAYSHCGGQGGVNCLCPIYSDGWLQHQCVGMTCPLPEYSFINNSMPGMFTFSLGLFINFLLHGWILQCHDGSHFLYITISCNAEYYHLYCKWQRINII